MKLTRSGEYAIRCVLYLAQQPEGSINLLADICNIEKTPRFLTSKVLHTLSRTGIIRSARGAGGGYALNKPASEISILDVIESIEGPISLNYCLKKGECLKKIDDNRDNFCPVHDVWEEAQEKLREILDSYKFDKLVQNATSVFNILGDGI